MNIVSRHTKPSAQFLTAGSEGGTIHISRNEPGGQKQVSLPALEELNSKGKLVRYAKKSGRRSYEYHIPSEFKEGV